MTIAEDTTNSPIQVVGSGATVQTAAFTPPNAGCVIVAHMWGDANNGSLDETLTASDTLGGTWSTPILDNARGGAAVAVSYRIVAAGTAASMQCLVTDNKGNVARSIYARIFTGTDLTNPFGATGTAGTAAISLVSTVANSWCWSAHLGSNATQTAGANTTQKTQFGGFDSGDAIGAYASTNTTASAGTTITLTESGGTTVHHVAYELVPPSGGATLNAIVAPAAGAVLTVAGVVTENAIVAPAAGAVLTVAATRTVLPVASLAASAQLAATGTDTGFATVAPAAGAVLGVSAGSVASAAVAFGAATALTSAAVRTVLPSATFAAGAALSPAAGRTVLPDGQLTAGAALAVGATITRPAAVVFGAGAVLSATPASNVPLVRAILVPSGAHGSTLVASGAHPSSLTAGGAATTTLVAGGV
jgi:hypothetical protein